MWRDREGDRTVDVTLGYDLNTCLLRSSDQSSLRQAPLPAGSFSMHVTPIPHSFFPSVSHSLSLPLFFFFFFLFTINSLSISWSLFNLPSLRSVSRGPPAPRVAHLLCLAVLLLFFTLPSALTLTSTHRALSFLPVSLTVAVGGAWGKKGTDGNE